MRRSRRQTRRVVRTERRAHAHRTLRTRRSAADRRLTDVRSRMALDDVTDAATVGGYRFGSLAARPDARPGRRGRWRLARVQRPASPARDRREMIERHLRRVDPTLRGIASASWRCRRRSTATPATRSRASGCRTCRAATVDRHLAIEGYQYVTRRPRAGNGVILASAAPGRLGVGRPLDDRPGPQADRRRRAARTARAVRVVRRPAQGPRHDRGARSAPTPARDGARRRSSATRSCACCATATSSATASRSSSSASARRCPPARRRSPCARARRMLPTGVLLHGPRQRPPRAGSARRVPLERGEGGLRDDVARVTQALAHELEFLIRRAPSSGTSSSPTGPATPGTDRTGRSRSGSTRIGRDADELP